MTTPPGRLLVVDDDADVRQALVAHFRRAGYAVSEAATADDALSVASRARPDVALVDLHLPGTDAVSLLTRLKEARPELEVLMLSAHSSVEVAVQAMKAGAYDYLAWPAPLPELDVRVQKARDKGLLARRARQWVDHVIYESPRRRLVGSSSVMRKVVAMIEKVAATDATVLVRGESGTGKELVARALHVNSPRRDRPLVTINCAALQESLLESELFGHEKGSFTGAVGAKRGLFELADGGTLFIDEIGEMQPALQAKLLRVLEDGRYRRVGGTAEQVADVRVVAATNRRLEDEIKRGRFREDLYYRLNVISIHLPALRDRRADIPELVDHFLTTRPIGPARHQVSAAAMEMLTRHDWPGNVRELANVIERAQILAEEQMITPDDLPDELRLPHVAAEPSHLAEAQRQHVLAVLASCGGNKVHAAHALGVSRRALYRLLDKHHLRDG